MRPARLCPRYESLFLLAMLFLCSGCIFSKGNSGGPNAVAGTGETFDGGGSYAPELERTKMEIARTASWIAAGIDLDQVCSGVDDVDSDQAGSVRDLLVSSAAGVRAAANRVPVGSSASALSISDENGEAHSVHAKTHFTADRVADWIKIAQTSLDAGDGWFLLYHELIHAAILVKDFVAQPSFPGADGGQRRLDLAGKCAHAYYLAHRDAVVLDRRFAGAGYRSNMAGVARAMVRQANGDIVITGCAQTRELSTGNVWTTTCTLSRFRSNGATDPAFGTNGSALLYSGTTLAPFGIGTTLFQGPDQNLYVVGDDVLRFTKDGVADAAFNAKAQVAIRSFGFTIAPRCLAFDSESRVIVVGIYNGQLALLRLTSEGVADMAFGRNGFTLQDGFGTSALISPTGEILVVGGRGWAAGVNGPTEATLFRFLPDGTPDRSLGGNGLATVVFHQYASQWFASLTLLPDGKVVLAGTVVRSNDPNHVPLALARILRNGDLDPTFGDGGRRELIFPESTGSTAARKIVPQNGGELLIGASYETDTPSHGGAGLVRVTAEGNVDPSFTSPDGQSGIVGFHLLGQNTSLSAILPGPDGTLLLAGVTAARQNDGTVLEQAPFLARIFGDFAP